MGKLTAVYLTGEGSPEEVALGEQIMGIIPDSVIDLVIRVAFCIVVFLVGSRIISLIRRIVRDALRRGSASEEVKQFLDSTLRFGLYTVLIFQIAIRLGVDATSIATLLGSAAVTVGLAFQGSLKNCIGGVLIMILHPFRVGDYIMESAYNNEGTVVEISVFYTKLATIDNKIILVPNGYLADTSITNVTNEENRRLEIKVGISYDSDIRAAKEILQGLAEEEERICKDRELAVYVDALGDSSVMLGMRVWTPTSDYWAVKWSLLEKIKYAFDEKGIAIPYPQMDVHVNPQKTLTGRNTVSSGGKE